MAKNMEAPFVFGVRVEGDAFTDRREETERLKANFTYGVNTILISPRRMGKTSLVDKVCSLVEGDDIKIARIDAFGCRSENDFINAFATAVVRATSNDFSLSLEYNASNQTTEEVLKLPEVIAQSKGYRIVVCIDEFQQIGDFPDSLTFQKKLRGIWQLQSHVSYCLYGSKKHMMEQMFQNQSYPFYRFGEQTEDLSAYQMNFLHALVNGVHTGFTQSAILANYRLGTAANITRLKKALIEKDLVMITAPKYLEMSDPILALWLKKRVWKE
nr:hypothetical protein [Prevotella sp.]